MIYTELKNLKQYRGLGTHLDEAFDYLSGRSLDGLAAGRYEINGDAVYMNVFDCETYAEEKGFFEAHERYADIQMTLDGEELVGVSDISKVIVKSIDKEKDLIEVKGAPEHYMRVSPGKALIVFPEDAHMVRIAAGRPCAIKKAVVKILMD